MKYILFAILFTISGCSTNKTSEKTTPEISKHKKKSSVEVKIKSSKNGNITIGDTVVYEYKARKLPLADSVKLTLDFLPIKTFYKNEAIVWNTSNAKTGMQQLYFTFYWGDTLNAGLAYPCRLLSDIKPEKYKYKVVKKWDHNVKAYTQGLEFSDGFLYEGTGNYGESMLYKLDLDKNEIIQSINLSDERFGEGITIIGDKIYQLTWRANIGYVYNKETLAELYEFSYPTEGWGLTNNGKELIMSDGSENIYFLDTEFMQQTKKIQVYDNKGPIIHLNELEYIDGIIYANIYGTEEIVAFNAETGKVTKSINLEGILDKSKIKTPIDVLNGIAWDKDNKRLIVTGKWWPYYYEIEMITSK